MLLNALQYHLVIRRDFCCFHLHIFINFVQRYCKFRYDARISATFFAQKMNFRAKRSKLEPVRDTRRQFLLVMRDHNECLVWTLAEQFYYLADKTAVAVVKAM